MKKNRICNKHNEEKFVRPRYYCKTCDKEKKLLAKEKPGFLEKNRAYHHAYRRKSTDNLDDCYVKKALIGKSSLTFKDIPKELVDLKRQQMLLKRLINKHKDEIQK